MVNDHTFELLLHRNLAQDDNFGLSSGVDDKTFVHYHFEMEISELTYKSYTKSYLEAKADIYCFPLVDSDKFKISNEDWSKAEKLKDK